jgi:hypothetical protein
MTTSLSPEIVPSPVLVFPAMRWPTVCGQPDCAHVACIRWRDQARRRCHRCEQPIAPGSEYREYREPVSRLLFMQEHVTCPTVKV